MSDRRSGIPALRVILSASGFLRENKVGSEVGERLRLALLQQKSGYAPSPLSSKISGIIMPARKSPQSLDGKELGGQTLDNKGLRARRFAL